MTGPAGPDHETPVPAPWGRDAVVLERLGGGYRNRVWAVRVGGHRRVARDSGASRSGPALDWELELLRELAGAGFRVPEPVPTLDGRPRGRGAGGDDLAGGGPAGRRAGLAAGRRRAGPAAPVHRRPGQRLGFASTRDLLSAERGGDMDLGRMPAEVVALCRAAWSALACTANAEVANGWTVEPDHAHRRLAELRRLDSAQDGRPCAGAGRAGPDCAPEPRPARGGCGQPRAPVSPVGYAPPPRDSATDRAGEGRPGPGGYGLAQGARSQADLGG